MIVWHKTKEVKHYTPMCQRTVTKGYPPEGMALEEAFAILYQRDLIKRIGPILSPSLDKRTKSQDKNVIAITVEAKVTLLIIA